MFTFKPKKVFDKLNKMDRKQAYTIGAIAVVSMVALLMLISAASAPKDESFDGMNARGYDLATMPFATDEAEKYLLAAKYPDMKENGSTLLYSAAEKQARQEEDAKAAEEEEAGLDGDDSSYDEISTPRSDNGGYSGYSGGGYAGRGGRRGKTEVGQLGSANIAQAGGSGVSSTYGPTGDFRQFKGREDRGNEAPIQLKTSDARQALAQFRQGSRAAASFKENRMTGARKALMGGNVIGSEAVGKDGVDLSKLQSGGLTLDTDAPPTSSDLDNLDKQVAEAAKKAEEKKKEENKLSFWEQLGQDLLRQMATSAVDAIMGGVGDTIRGTINGPRAYYSARRGASNDVYSYVSGAKGYDVNNPYGLTEAQYNTYKTAVTGDNKLKPGAFYRKYGKSNAYATSQGSSARSEAVRNTQIGQSNVKTQQSTTTATK